MKGLILAVAGGLTASPQHDLKLPMPTELTPLTVNAVIAAESAAPVASGEWVALLPASDVQNLKIKIHEGGPESLIFIHDLRVADTATGDVAVRAGDRVYGQLVIDDAQAELVVQRIIESLLFVCSPSGQCQK